ncbi:hypothetical protein [Fimbriiglobus ruber]|uniref:Uncharacterized protein n=1 Tax=Fimbriiglobus ruber TaxID=1908690 RepID=A0A225E9E8_9BACT|nr:hypothetical protein [Fimbriiglobus ruber]OWK45047.1 hypothetical protein FRUB_01378 [Fimbriiglobus ruber]
MHSRFGRLLLTAIAAGIGFGVGVVAALIAMAKPVRDAAHYAPFPHSVPKYPGGVAFRFAMAHDVVHERFPRHGPAYYTERNRLTRAKLAALPSDDPAAFPLADDLGVGLERLGRSDDAAAVLRDKLARQQARGLTGRDLYTSYANLGTFLVHANFQKALAGDPAAKARFHEGLDLVKKSVEVNPEAHFGREAWQVAIGQFLLAAANDPSRLKATDFLGNKLDESVVPTEGRPLTKYSGYSYILRKYSDALADPGALTDETVRQSIRASISAVGSQEKVDVSSGRWHVDAVPFDEPMLGIIGMWRQGGGANPHFALAIGEIMLRVGQRYIAWAAFERAHQLAGRFWPDPALQQFLRDHCRQRQATIEETLPPEEVADLRPRFEAELAHGEAYQRAYQEYEAKKLAAGIPLNDEHLFDEFHATHPPIASATGPEEWYAYQEEAFQQLPKLFGEAVKWGCLAAGVTALLAAWALRPRVRATLTPVEVEKHASPG